MQPAFTLVELLIVIAVIGLLTAVIAGVAGKVSEHQRVALTQTTMRNARSAIDEFAEKNPLRQIYDAKTPGPSFGPYPPYQLRDRQSSPANAVATVLEPPAPPPLGPPSPYTLRGRLVRDLGAGADVQIDDDNDPANRANDDIRALYAYLKVFSESSLAHVPERALKPLTTQAEYVNTTGNASAAGSRREVLGIYDAWGVPMDYFLYVKLEWGVRADGSVGLKITDRVPVLRSRGISREVYDVQQREQTGGDPHKWIFSEVFPSPPADAGNTGFWADGVFDGDQDDAGWARVVPIDGPGERLGYVPDPAQDR